VSVGRLYRNYKCFYIIKLKDTNYEKFIVFQDVKPYNLVAIYRLEKTCIILLQGQSKPNMKGWCLLKEGRRRNEAVKET
jgi:hypothetical protein